MDKSIVAIISEKSIPLFKVLDERQNRLRAATEALPFGRGGITAVANATGLCRAAIRRRIRRRRVWKCVVLSMKDVRQQVKGK